MDAKKDRYLAMNLFQKKYSKYAAQTNFQFIQSDSVFIMLKVVVVGITRKL